MSFIRTLHGARGQRPTGPLTLNRESQQSLGLVRLYPMAGDAHQLVQGRQAAQATYENTSEFRGAPGIGGLAYYPAANADADFSTGEAIQTILPTWAGAIVCWVYPTSAFNSNSRRPLWGQDGFTTPEFSAQVYDDNSFYVGGTDTGMTRLTVAATADTWQQYQWNCYIYTFSSVSSQLYANGRQIASGAGQSPPSVNVSGYFAWGNYGPVATRGYSNALTGYVVHGGIYSRQFSAADAWTAYDPATRWDLYRVPSRTVFFDLGASSFKSAWAVRANTVLQPGVIR